MALGPWRATDRVGAPTGLPAGGDPTAGGTLGAPPLRSLRWMESFLQTLLDQGFSDPNAVAAYRAFSSFLLVTGQAVSSLTRPGWPCSMWSPGPRSVLGWSLRAWGTTSTQRPVWGSARAPRRPRPPCGAKH